MTWSHLGACKLTRSEELQWQWVALCSIGQLWCVGRGGWRTHSRRAGQWYPCYQHHPERNSCRRHSSSCRCWCLNEKEAQIGMLRFCTVTGKQNKWQGKAALPMRDMSKVCQPAQQVPHTCPVCRESPCTCLLIHMLLFISVNGHPRCLWKPTVKMWRSMINQRTADPRER